jgi:hypothetical protein
MPACPDLVGVSVEQLLERVDRLEKEINGNFAASEIRPRATGIWPGEDFSI